MVIQNIKAHTSKADVFTSLHFDVRANLFDALFQLFRVGNKTAEFCLFVFAMAVFLNLSIYAQRASTLSSTTINRIKPTAPPLNAKRGRPSHSRTI